MKRSSATGFSPVSKEWPHITKTLPHIYNDRKVKKLQQPSKPVPPPSEELVSRLNNIGREYPFCVYYKQKLNDPL